MGIVLAITSLFVFTVYLNASDQRTNASGELVGLLEVERGELLFSDNFERSEIGGNWVEHFKEISLKDGVLFLHQVPNEHPAIARCEMGLQDTIFDFELRLVDAKRAVFVVNGKGHVFHVAFREIANGLEVSIKDYSNGGSTAQSVSWKEKKGEWYSISLVQVKDRLEAIVGGRSIVTLRSPGLAAEKTLFQLNGVGSHIEYDNMEVWSVAQ